MTFSSFISYISHTIDFYNNSSHLSNAYSYPFIIADGCNPEFNNNSAYDNNSPERVTKKFVPSPKSSFCIFDAITIKLAAGWCTFISYSIVYASLDTNNLSI